MHVFDGAIAQCRCTRQHCAEHMSCLATAASATALPAHLDCMHSYDSHTATLKHPALRKTQSGKHALSHPGENLSLHLRSTAWLTFACGSNNPAGLAGSKGTTYPTAVTVSTSESPNTAVQQRHSCCLPQVRITSNPCYAVTTGPS